MSLDDLQKTSDEALCARAGQDPRAGDCLFKRYVVPLTLFLKRRFSGIEHEAIASEVLQTALRHVGQHGLRKSFRGLVFRVAKQQGWKAKQRVDAHALREIPLAENRCRMPVEPAVDPADIAVQQIDLFEALFAALKSLTPHQRRVLLLRYADELSEAEIARRCGISESAVKSRLHHARKKLRADPNLTYLLQERG